MSTASNKPNSVGNDNLDAAAADAAQVPAKGGLLERFFKLSAHNTTVSTEVIAGITTFMTMVYIVFVNPQILSAAKTPQGKSRPVR